MTALDASALLALVFRERGHERVTEVLADSMASTVNLAEVLGRFEREGLAADALLAELQASPIRWVEFDAAQAATSANLLPLTRRAGLSLGDRACLALALSYEVAAMTADRAWKSVAVGVPIEIIR